MYHLVLQAALALMPAIKPSCDFKTSALGFYTHLFYNGGFVRGVLQGIPQARHTTALI